MPLQPTRRKAAAPTAPAAPSLYVWQHYTLRTGQPRRLGEYFAKARVPALTRAGAGPVGVFEPIAGPPQPSLFALTPFASTAPFLALEDTFAKDAEYQAAAAPYADATAADPAFVRQETWLLQAFPTFPGIELPAQTAAKAPRIFELRIYESPSEKAHLKKVEMFEKLGEIAIFKRTGLVPVFFARMIAGPRMPCLAYMLVHDSLRRAGEELEQLHRRSGVAQGRADAGLRRRGHRLEHHHLAAAAVGGVPDLSDTSHATVPSSRRAGPTVPRRPRSADVPTSPPPARPASPRPSIC